MFAPVIIYFPISEYKSYTHPGHSEPVRFFYPIIATVFKKQKTFIEFDSCYKSLLLLSPNASFGETQDTNSPKYISGPPCQQHNQNWINIHILEHLRQMSFAHEKLLQVIHPNTVKWVQVLLEHKQPETKPYLAMSPHAGWRRSEIAPCHELLWEKGEMLSTD